ncbi:hypothetical protein SNEBB_011329 [Seison nebaliae]|nr:hypothetical protein SNEBB_011329 [Seison nebaliae]
MSLKTLPFLLINLGGEMVYILDQRLRDQEITSEKKRKIMQDIITSMFHRPFVEEVFKPQEMFSTSNLRNIFDKIAHASILKLNSNNMNKLYDLMTMIVKYQLTKVLRPRDCILISLAHLDTLRQMLTEMNQGNTNNCKLVLRNIDFTAELFRKAYCEMSDYELLTCYQQILIYFQDLRIRVSIFLKNKKQNSDGSFIIDDSGLMPFDTEVPGEIRYYEDKRVVETKRFETNVKYIICNSPGNFAIKYKGHRLPSKLGENMYINTPTTTTSNYRNSTDQVSQTSSYVVPDIDQGFIVRKSDLLQKMIIGEQKSRKDDIQIDLFADDCDELDYNEYRTDVEEEKEEKVNFTVLQFKENSEHNKHLTNMQSRMKKNGVDNSMNLLSYCHCGSFIFPNIVGEYNDKKYYISPGVWALMTLLNEDQKRALYELCGQTLIQCSFDDIVTYVEKGLPADRPDSVLGPYHCSLFPWECPKQHAKYFFESSKERHRERLKEFMNAPLYRKEPQVFWRKSAYKHMHLTPYRGQHLPDNERKKRLISLRRRKRNYRWTIWDTSQCSMEDGKQFEMFTQKKRSDSTIIFQTNIKKLMKQCQKWMMRKRRCLDVNDSNCDNGFIYQKRRCRYAQQLKPFCKHDLKSMYQTKKANNKVEESERSQRSIVPHQETFFQNVRFTKSYLDKIVKVKLSSTRRNKYNLESAMEGRVKVKYPYGLLQKVAMFPWRYQYNNSPFVKMVWRTFMVTVPIFAYVQYVKGVNLMISPYDQVHHKVEEKINKLIINKIYVNIITTLHRPLQTSFVHLEKVFGRELKFFPQAKRLSISYGI